MIIENKLNESELISICDVMFQGDRKKMICHIDKSMAKAAEMNRIEFVEKLNRDLRTLKGMVKTENKLNELGV